MREADVIGMVPTTSTSITLLLGDCLASTAMYEKFSKDEFKVFHLVEILETLLLSKYHGYK